MPTLTLRGASAEIDGRRARITGTLTAEYTLLIGATASPSTTASMLAAWPNCGYSREYGKDGPDSDTLTDLTADETNKFALPGFAGVWHQSWKDSPEDLAAYRFNDPRYFTHHHEPAPEKSPATYRADAARMAEILATHPDAGNVLGNGPNLTRWQIANAPVAERIDPADYWYTGATFFSADTYNPSTSRYWTPEEMFQPIADAARGFGVPWMAPEWGGKRLASDTTGEGRAAWIRDCLAYLAEQPDVLAVGWWDIGECRVSNHPTWPEFDALAEAMA
jgi:hypothetical protein